MQMLQFHAKYSFRMKSDFINEISFCKLISNFDNGKRFGTIFGMLSYLRW